MTVSTTDNVAIFPGNDLAAVFPFEFAVLEPGDLVVTHIDGDGIVSTLGLDVSYSVTLNDDQSQAPGGSISYPISGAPLPSGERLTVTRIVDFLQQVDLVNQGAWLPDVVERRFDKTIMAIQQNAEGISRSIKVSPGDAGASVTLPPMADHSGQYLVVNGAGNGVTFSDVAGQASSGDGSSLYLNVKDFGATGNGVVDDSVAFQAAVNYASTLIEAGTWTITPVAIFVPHGRYVINNTVTMHARGICFVGPTKRGAQLICSVDDLVMFEVGDTTDTVIHEGYSFENLYFRCLTSTDGTTAIRINNSTRCRVSACVFYNWYVAFEGNKCTSPLITDCVFKVDGALRGGGVKSKAMIWAHGNALGTGGGYHVTDCEFEGGPGNDACLNIVLIQEADGFYMMNCHMHHADFLIHVNPQGVIGYNKILDLFFVNCYFDSDVSNPKRTILIDGSVEHDAGTPGLDGYAHNITFTGCLFRGSNTADYAVYVTLADAGGFIASGVRKFFGLTFDGCHFRQYKNCALFIRGQSNGFLEVYGLTISDCYFGGNGSAPTQGVIDGIIEAETLSMTGNTFDAGNGVAALSVRTLASTAQRQGSYTIQGNDWSRSTYTDRALGYSALTGVRHNIAGNTYAGFGQTWDENIPARTNGAETVVPFDEILPNNNGGWVSITIHGVDAAGSSWGHWEYFGTFNRPDGGAAVWSSGGLTAVRAISNGSIVTPVVNLSLNRLSVSLTGTAGWNTDWTVEVKRVQVR